MFHSMFQHVSHPSDSSSCSLPIASANCSEESASVSAAASAMDGHGLGPLQRNDAHFFRCPKLSEIHGESRHWKTASWELMRKMFKPVPPWRSWSARHVCQSYIFITQRYFHTHCHGNVWQLESLFESSQLFIQKKGIKQQQWTQLFILASAALAGPCSGWRSTPLPRRPPVINPWMVVSHCHGGIPLSLGFWHGYSHLEMDDMVFLRDNPINSWMMM